MLFGVTVLLYFTVWTIIIILIDANYNDVLILMIGQVLGKAEAAISETL